MEAKPKRKRESKQKREFIIQRGEWLEGSESLAGWKDVAGPFENTAAAEKAARAGGLEPGVKHRIVAVTSRFTPMPDEPKPVIRLVRPGDEAAEEAK